MQDGKVKDSIKLKSHMAGSKSCSYAASTNASAPAVPLAADASGGSGWAGAQRASTAAAFPPPERDVREEGAVADEEDDLVDDDDYDEGIADEDDDEAQAEEGDDTTVADGDNDEGYDLIEQAVRERLASAGLQRFSSLASGVLRSSFPLAHHLLGLLRTWH